MSKILSHVHTLDHTAANAVVSDAKGSYLYWPDHVDAESALAANDRDMIPMDVVKVLGPINNTMITIQRSLLVSDVVHNILVHRNGHVTLLSGGEVVGEAGHERVSYTLDDVPVTITEEVVRYG